jgi:hypothetical protein
MKKTHFKPLFLIFDVHPFIWFTCDNGLGLLKEETLSDTGVSQLPYRTTFHLLFAWNMSLCSYVLLYLCPEHPGVRLNVMLQPLIEELKKLWQGVEAYDCFKK